MKIRLTGARMADFSGCDEVSEIVNTEFYLTGAFYSPGHNFHYDRRLEGHQ